MHDPNKRPNFPNIGVFWLFRLLRGVHSEEKMLEGKLKHLT